MALAPVSLFAEGAHPIDTGATEWMLTSTMLVLLMVPGLAMFYGGLVRTKNVFGTMMHSFGAMGIMTILWVPWLQHGLRQKHLGGWFGCNPTTYF